MLNQADAGAAARRIHHAFLPWAQSRPEAIALADDLITLRYGELPAAVDRCQQLLRVQIRNMFNPTPLDED